MKKNNLVYIAILGCIVFFFFGCSKSSNTTPTPTPNPTPSSLTLNYCKVSNTSLSSSSTIYGIALQPIIKLNFNNKINRNTVSANIVLTKTGLNAEPTVMSYENNDSTVVITPSTNLLGLTKYDVSINNLLQTTQGGTPTSITDFVFITQIDSTNKFATISDNVLLDTIQKRTFSYFWDFAHPVSGLARERNTSGETVTTGGSGFGIMCLPIAINRNFITRSQGITRLQTIVSFLKNTAQKFHGAFPHWLNGSTGVVVPFSTLDNGADLVETSYLLAGLLTARQYFNGTNIAETNLRNDINSIWNAVEWNWFRQGTQNVLYWHWSPNYGWQMNHKIEGWNECLITYILAASSTTYNIPQTVYSQGFARGGAMANGNTYYGYTLPLGSSNGGPLFMSQYSFLGISPVGLNDAYANYSTQVTNHTKINYAYCMANPQNYYGYSNSCWGLTASDVPNGYNANEPNNDVGVISPTAAISSLAFAPTESMNAIRFFYYKLGDKIFKEYGFVDAFSLNQLWFANSYLAIDQGPEIIMIENYRTGLIWNLLTSCTEIKSGMLSLGFTAPYL